MSHKSANSQPLTRTMVTVPLPFVPHLATQPVSASLCLKKRVTHRALPHYASYAYGAPRALTLGSNREVFTPSPLPSLSNLPIRSSHNFRGIPLQNLKYIFFFQDLFYVLYLIVYSSFLELIFCSDIFFYSKFSLVSFLRKFNFNSCGVTVESP